MNSFFRLYIYHKIARLISLSILAASLVSCETIFVHEERSIINIQNKDDLDAAVGGVKDLLTFLMLDEYFDEISLYSDDLIRSSWPYYSYYHKSSDIGVGGYINPELNEIYWKSLYQIIISANNAILQIDNGKFNFEGIEQSLGELLFVRSYCYFLLVRLYGQVPVVSDTDINEKLTKGSYEEIYSFIENDLLRAYGNVLRSKTIHESLTVDQASVKALLAEVYLSWAGYPAKNVSKYIDAARTSKELLDSSSYFNLAFISKFEDLWTNGLVNTSEDLFCFYSNNIELCRKLHMPYMRLIADHIVEYFYSEDKAVYANRQVGRHAAEGSFYNNYPAGYRKDLTFFTTIYVPEDPSGYFDGDTGMFYINHIEDKVRPAYRKFYADTTNHEFNQYGEYYWLPKLNFLRLTHTILTFAEAQARSGEVTSAAYEWMNKIRRRANNVDINQISKYDLPPGLSAKAFADSVVNERSWELAGEFEGRWFDLVRLEMVEEVNNSKMDDDKIDNMKPNSNGEYFLEIPIFDKLINPNLN